MSNNPFESIFGLNDFNNTFKTLPKDKELPDIDLVPYINRIKKLERHITYLISILVNEATQVHKQNSDYWYDILKRS